jgi:hypothetical protein
MVPSAFIDQPAAGAARRAHSPVSGLLISRKPPCTVGSSVPPGRGATTGACTTSTSLALSFPWRRESERPAIVSSMA